MNISPSQFKALHQWFKECADVLNGARLYKYMPLSGRRVKWDGDTFKCDLFKPFIKKMYKLDSTKDIFPAQLDECILAISSHILTETGVKLPELPSLERMRIESILKERSS